MTSEIASMLDELMGRNRNDTSGKASAKLTPGDPDVCQFYLCGFCPNELFVNTKADLGPCKKIHCESLRKEYQVSEEVFKLGFEEKFFDFLQECMIEVERKIKRNKQRLDQNQDEDGPINAETAEHANKLSILSIEITNLLLEVERLGELGEVQEAMAKTEEVEKLKEERERIRLATKVAANPDSGYHGQQEKQMEVCEICGSFLIVGDSRVDDHLTGKQHMGYARIKAKMNELKEIFDKNRAERGEKPSEDRSNERKDERERQSSREGDRQRRDDRGERRRDDRQSCRDDRRDGRREERPRRSRDREDRRRRDDRDGKTRDHDQSRRRDRDRRRSRSRSRHGEKRHGDRNRDTRRDRERRN